MVDLRELNLFCPWEYKFPGCLGGILILIFYLLRGLKVDFLNFFRKKPKVWNFTLISGPPLLVEKGRGEPRRENHPGGRIEYYGNL